MLICCPITAAHPSEIEKLFPVIRRFNPDVLELRADYLKDPAAMACEAVEILALAKIPLLFTLRNKDEGGKWAAADGGRQAVFTAALDTHLLSYIDIELAAPPPARSEIIDYARKKGAKVIISHHDFTKTPPAAEITATLTAERDAGADIVKVAYTPHSAKDVDNLIRARDAFAAASHIPVIAISMGELGRETRLSGTYMTYATLDPAAATAPGQVDITFLKAVT